MIWENNIGVRGAGGAWGSRWEVAADVLSHVFLVLYLTSPFHILNTYFIKINKERKVSFLFKFDNICLDSFYQQQLCLLPLRLWIPVGFPATRPPRSPISHRLSTSWVNTWRKTELLEISVLVCNMFFLLSLNSNFKSLLDFLQIDLYFEIPHG